MDADSNMVPRFLLWGHTFGDEARVVALFHTAEDASEFVFCCRGPSGWFREDSPLRGFESGHIEDLNSLPHNPLPPSPLSDGDSNDG